MTTVRIDGFLREFGAGPKFESTATDVAGMLDELERAYPRLRLKVRDETGEVRRFVRVFVNGEDIRNGSGITTPLHGADTVDILHSIQGG
jgi:molybdopterin synthase sulfur carrier subunit